MSRESGTAGASREVLMETQGGAEVESRLSSEIGQSFYLMGLMAAVLSAWVGLGLLAVRVLG
jgi:hypothetical protein